MTTLWKQFHSVDAVLGFWEDTKVGCIKDGIPEGLKLYLVDGLAVSSLPSLLSRIPPFFIYSLSIVCWFLGSTAGLQEPGHELMALIQRVEYARL